MSAHFASIRVDRLKTGRQIQAATAHALRLDSTSRLRVRCDADSTQNYCFNPWRKDDVADRRFDYLEDLRLMKAATGAIERGKTAPVTHCICVVSPGWLAETGDAHDPSNPRNRELFDAAIAWARKTFGPEALLSARLDLDEKGAGVVDLILAPIATSKKGTLYLSISPVLRELQLRYGGRKSFSALQDSWAEFVHEHLDPAISRGKEKVGRGPDRLTPEAYAAKVETEKALEKILAERAEIDRLSSELAAARQERQEAYERMAERERRCVAAEEELERRRTELEQAARAKLLRAGRRVVEDLELGVCAWLAGKIELVEAEETGERRRLKIAASVTAAEHQRLAKAIGPAVEFGLERLLSHWASITDDLGAAADEIKAGAALRAGRS